MPSALLAHSIAAAHIALDEFMMRWLTLDGAVVLVVLQSLAQLGITITHPPHVCPR